MCVRLGGRSLGSMSQYKGPAAGLSGGFLEVTCDRCAPQIFTRSARSPIQPIRSAARDPSNGAGASLPDSGGGNGAAVHPVRRGSAVVGGAVSRASCGGRGVGGRGVGGAVWGAPWRRRQRRSEGTPPRTSI